MPKHYEDILTRIDDKPTWWDENGVPRFGSIHPADEVSGERVIFEIECQGCKKKFTVAFTHHSQNRSHNHVQPTPRYGHLLLSDFIESKQLKYGDPPSHKVTIKNETNYCVGTTMQSRSVRVLEYWVSPIKREPLGFKASPKKENAKQYEH